MVPPLLLFLATVAVFWPATGNEFVHFDDDAYVTANVWVREGVSWAGLHWALTTFHEANWHPLAWLSHMLDVSCFGMQPFGHHLTSVLLHAAAAAALLVFLRAATGARWLSLAAGALFALHPLRVESVAWVAERKDVLCGLFWMLSLVAYAAYLRRPAARRYLALLGLFALALLSKPMALTLPFALLLLDYWPFGRWRAAAAAAGAAAPVARQSRFGGLVAEKAPLFGMAAASAWVTFLAQSRGGSVGTLEHYPFAVRVANALDSYAGYLGQTFWPRDLAVIYSHARGLPPLPRLVVALAILAGVTLAALRGARGRPALAVGWFWFLGTLVPVLGLVQVGLQGKADRYTYLPAVGIAIALCWGVAGGTRPRRGPAIAWLLVAAALLVALSGATREQIAWWRGDRTLFEHAIAVSPDNWAAHLTLGVILEKQGAAAEAQSHYAAMKAIKREFARSHGGMGVDAPPPDPAEQALFTAAGAPVPEPAREAYRQGNELVRGGRYAEAAERFATAARLAPAFVQAINNRGVARAGLGDRDGAAADFGEAARLSPDAVQPHVNLGGILALRGEFADAETQYRRAGAIDPESVVARLNLGDALLAQGKRYRAGFAYREALLLSPENEEAARKLREAKDAGPGRPAGGQPDAGGTTSFELFP